MQIEQHEGKYLVSRGSYKPQYFSFYVDYDRSCWTAKRHQAQHFLTHKEASECMAEVRARNRTRAVEGTMRSKALKEIP